MTTLNPNHVAWCRAQFNRLRDGGVWGIPRSGMIFTKRGDTFVLTAVMPYVRGMPCSDTELRQQQRDEFELNRLHFAAAGITIIDEVGLWKPSF